MEKSPARKALEQAYPNPQADLLNPDNHDKVHIALGLLSAEAAENLTDAIRDLKRQLVGVSEVIQQQGKEMIVSNEKMAASNEKYAKWNMRLAMALVGTTSWWGYFRRVYLSGKSFTTRTVWLTSTNLYRPTLKKSCSREWITGTQGMVLLLRTSFNDGWLSRTLTHRSGTLAGL